MKAGDMYLDLDNNLCIRLDKPKKDLFSPHIEDSDKWVDLLFSHEDENYHTFFETTGEFVKRDLDVNIFTVIQEILNES